MDLAQSDAILQEQAKEKEYSGMTVLQLIEVAKKENLDTIGDKSVLVQSLTDKAVGKTKDNDQILLEEAIMTWPMQDMKDYLQTMKKPSWGSKKNMMERIISNIAIDDTVEITREYRTYLAAMTETTEEGKVPEDDETHMETNTEQNEGNVTKEANSNEVEERKRKREEVEVEEEDESEDRMDIDGEEKEETEEKEIVPRKQFTLRRSKVVHEADEVVVTKVVSPVEDNPNPISKGKGRVGSTDGADEAGWKTQGGGDNDSVDTTNVSNVRRTRIGLMLTAPPSGEPNKQVCRVAQQWFKK